MKSQTLSLSGFIVLIFLWGCTPNPKPYSHSAVDAYHQGLALVESALDTLGGTAGIKEAGGIYLQGSGTYNLSTRLQGMHPEGDEPYPIKEQLAVDLKTGKVTYESDTHVNPDAREWLRYSYDNQNRMLFLDLYSGLAFWDSEPGLNSQRKRYSNMIPQLLLEEALTHRSSLTYSGDDERGHKTVTFHSPDFGLMKLHISEDSRYLTGVSYLKDMPLIGDTEIRWKFKSYGPVNGIGLYPSGYTVHINKKKLKEITYFNVQAGVDGAPILEIPDTITVPEKPDPPSATLVNSSPPSPYEREPTQLAEGIFVFPHIRPGFHPLVVEFDNYMMVVDAPAGWFEMHQLPAMQWVQGATSSSTGRRLLDAIQEKFPDKPVRYVALTHFHSDHAGGIRPFIEAGATILASPVTASVIQEAAKNRFTLEPDELTGRNITPKVKLVNGELSLSDGTMEVRLIDVGKNPHAKGMLVVWLPKQKILYQSDLFEPTNLDFFPNKSRIPVMKWFVAWLDQAGLNAEKIYAIHAGLRVTNEHLETIRTLSNNHYRE